MLHSRGWEKSLVKMLISIKNPQEHGVGSPSVYVLLLLVNE